MADFSLKTHKGEIYNPLPTQLLFHQSRARHRSYIGFLGAGKSLCGSIEAFTRAIEKPGHRAGRTIICRQTYPQLINSSWQTFRQVVLQSCPEIIEREVRSTNDIRMILKNGWEFRGMNLQNYQDFGSWEADYVWIDEVNDDGVGLDTYSMLAGRIGRNIVPYEQAKIWCTGNPGGRNWVYDLFFKHKFEGTKRYEDTEGFQPKPDENIYLPPEYWDNLRAFYSEQWVAKFLEGSFDVFEGMVLDNFSPELHLIDPFEIPPEWPRYRGLDHGWTNPTAVVWVAVDPDGNHYVYREYYKKCAVPQTNAAAVLAASGPEEDMIQWTVMDPAGRQTQTAGGTAQKLVDQYRDGGLICRLGNNDVRASISLIKSLLQPQAEGIFPRWHGDRGSGGSPKLFIFRSCRHLISEIQLWQWKAVRPGGVDREEVLAKNDHLIAALRYLLMELPRAPKVSTRRTYDWLDEALKDNLRELEDTRHYIGA